MHPFLAGQPPLIPEDDLSRAARRKIERLAAMRQRADPEDRELIWQAERKIWADDIKRQLRVYRRSG